MRPTISVLLTPSVRLICAAKQEPQTSWRWKYCDLSARSGQYDGQYDVAGAKDSDQEAEAVKPQDGAAALLTASVSLLVPLAKPCHA